MANSTITADPKHAGIARLVGDLNHLYRSEPALHAKDCDPSGFQWVQANDANNGVLGFMRLGFETDTPILVVFNFTTAVHRNYRLGVPRGGEWKEILNSDAPVYGGSGQGNFGEVQAVRFGSHGQPNSIAITVPPLGMVLLKPVG